VAKQLKILFSKHYEQIWDVQICDWIYMLKLKLLIIENLLYLNLFQFEYYHLMDHLSIE